MTYPFTANEIAYDISRIPAVCSALALMPEHEAENGRGPTWESLLDAAAVVMDDEIREELHSEWTQDRSPCDFLAVYAARHEAKYGIRFEF